MARLVPLSGRKVLFTKRGASANGSQNSVSTVTVRNGALGFSNGEKCCLEGNESVFFTVNGTPSVDTSLPVTPAITVTDNVRIINLGADTGTSTPNYDGADSNLSIYSSNDDGGTAVTNNLVTTNSLGLAVAYPDAAIFDVTILDADDNISSDSVTYPDQDLYRDEDEHDQVTHKLNSSNEFIIRNNTDSADEFRVDEEGLQVKDAQSAFIPGVLTTGTKAIMMRLPYAGTFTKIDLMVGTAPTGADLQVDVWVGAAGAVPTDADSLFGTATIPTIAAGAKFGSVTAVDPGDETFTAGSVVLFNIDQIGSTVAGSDLTITLEYTRNEDGL